jgi:hypothetical protein
VFRKRDPSRSLQSADSVTLSRFLLRKLHLDISPSLEGSILRRPLCFQSDNFLGSHSSNVIAGQRITDIRAVLSKAYSVEVSELVHYVSVERNSLLFTCLEF